MTQLKYKFPIILLIFSICQQVASKGSSITNIVATVLNHYVDNLKTTRKIDNSLSETPETRGGYGGGGGHGGGHGHGYGAITLDPVSIISLLALGAFLINNILQLLRANQAPAPAPAPAGGGGGRSMDDINIPVEITHPDSLSSENSERLNKHSQEGEPSFSQFFENVGSLYYLQPKKRNICIKKVVCKYVNAQKSREDGHGTFKTRIFDFMLSTITRIVAPELNAHSVREDACGKFNKLCSDSLLHDAKISVENKVYAEVSNLISNLAVKQLVG